MEGFIGQIILVGFNFAPRSWAICDGRLLAITSNTALFSILGTTYGGNGTTTFALPDLRGRVPVGPRSGPGRSNYALGQTSGQERVTLISTQIPSHTHTLSASTAAGTSTLPENNFIANSLLEIDRGTNREGESFGAPVNVVAMNGNSITSQGGNQAHENRQPYLGLNYVICLQGIFPPRS